MNSSLVAISTLVKSNIGEKCLINVLINISTQALKEYLKCENISKENASKRKTDLVEMIAYGCIIDKLNKRVLEDILTKQANQILNEKGPMVKSLPGHGNAKLKKKYIKPYIIKNPFIKL